MNTLNIFRYIKEVLEENTIIFSKVKDNIFPVAVLRDVPMPYIIQTASLIGNESSKDGTYERTVESRIYVFGENIDEVISLIDEVQQTVKKEVSKDYFQVSEVSLESWEFMEDEQIFGGEIVFNIKTY